MFGIGGTSETGQGDLYLIGTWASWERSGLLGTNEAGTARGWKRSGIGDPFLFGSLALNLDYHM